MDKTPINLGRIFVFLFVVLFIRAGLTKAGLIPNRFDVGYLHSDKKISLRLPFEIQSNRDSDVLNLHVNLRSPFEIQYFYDNESDWILEHRVVDPDSHVNHRPFYFPDTISTDIDKENNMVTGSVDEVIRLNSEDGFFIIDVNDSNYPQGCKTPGLLNPEKCILRTSNNYCIAPYQTESTQTRYEANSYCNSLNILGLSRELPYAYSHENNIYWNNLINIKSKIYGFNAYGSEKTGHYRAYPVNPTFENCSTLNGNCGNEYGSYKLSVRCVAPCGKMPSEVKNVNNDDLLKNNGLKNEKEQDDKTIKGNICPEGYKYGTYYNTIKGYTNIEYPPNKNRENYEQNFENWEKGLRDKEVKEFTFGPFEGCIPDDGKLEKCTDSGTYDYVFCTINMILLNNECPKGYSFLKAGVAGPYDLCQGKSDLIIDSKGYIHTYQIPLQDDCEFFAGLGILPGDGHCGAVKGENGEPIMPKDNNSPRVYLYMENQHRNNFHDKDLSKAIESMGLRFSSCSNVFFLPTTEDDLSENYTNLSLSVKRKHYYWDRENKKMILIPNVNSVSRDTCGFYDKWFGQKEFNYEDKDLSKAVESMGLTFSNCPNIFFQPVKDDESMAKYYWNEDHDYYYWDKENKKMILMPNISYVGSSDCESYDKWFEEDEFKTEMEDLDIKIIERQTCDEYSPHRNICSSKVKCKKVFDMGDFIKYKCCNQEGECIFRESYTVHIPDCSKGPC